MASENKESEGTYSGPLPDPDVLAAYDGMIEGSPAVIFEMVRNEQKFRQMLEEKALSVQAAGMFFGQVLAAAVALGLLLSVTILGLNDQFALAALLAVLGLSGITAAYIKGRQAMVSRYLHYMLARRDYYQKKREEQRR